MPELEPEDDNDALLLNDEPLDLPESDALDEPDPELEPLAEPANWAKSLCAQIPSAT